MKVTQALIFAVLAFQANAFLDNQETNQEVTQTGGGGGNGGDNKQEGGNGGDAAQSVSSVLTAILFLRFETTFRVRSWLSGRRLHGTIFPYRLSLHLSAIC